MQQSLALTAADAAAVTHDRGACAPYHHVSSYTSTDKHFDHSLMQGARQNIRINLVNSQNGLKEQNLCDAHLALVSAHMTVINCKGGIAPEQHQPPVVGWTVAVLVQMLPFAAAAGLLVHPVEQPWQ